MKDRDQATTERERERLGGAGREREKGGKEGRREASMGVGVHENREARKDNTDRGILDCTVCV